MIIAYGIASEGMGHYTRSKVAIEYLISKGHEVHVFTSDKVYDLFSPKFPNIYRIDGFHLIYKDGCLDGRKSTVNIIKELPTKGISTIKKILEHFDRINPEIVVSDFEPFVAVAAKKNGIPLISANNISIIYKTDCLPRNIKASYNTIITGTAEFLTSLRPDYYIIPTFFFPKTKSKHIILTTPPIRNSIISQEKKSGSHILVYHTSDTAIDMLHLIKRIDMHFKVYGFGKKDDDKNITYHEFNENEFAKDLATAKAVITGGDFSLISEALYLKKPVSVKIPAMSRKMH